MAEGWSTGVVLIVTDGTKGSGAALDFVTASERESQHLTPLTRQGLEDAFTATVDAKGKRKTGVPMPPLATLLANRLKADEEEGRASKARGEFYRDPLSNGPDVVYLLTDFPTTAEEAEALLKASTNDVSLLDGVVSLVWKGVGVKSTGDRISSDSGVPAFSRLPHLEEARDSAAASRAVKQAATEKSAAETLSAAMSEDAEDEPLEEGTAAPEAPAVDKRRKSFELPTPLTQWSLGKDKTTANSPKPSAVPLVERLVEMVGKNRSSSAWADLWFAEVVTSSDAVDDSTGDAVPKPPTFVLSETESAALGRSLDRRNFKTWIASVNKVKVPDSVASRAFAAKAVKDAEANVASLDPMRMVGRVAVVSGKKSKAAEKEAEGNSPWLFHPQLNAYANLVSEVPDSNCSIGAVLFCMVEAIVLTDEFNPSKNPSKEREPLASPGGDDDIPTGPLGPGFVALDYGDATGLRAALTEILLSDGQAPELTRSKLCSRLMVGIERRVVAATQNPRLSGFGALPLVSPRSEAERGVDRSELLTFSSLSPKDVDTARHTMLFEHMINSKYTAATVKTFAPWSFADRTVHERLSAHVLKQVLAAECRCGYPDVLRHYDAATDTLLLATYQPTARHRCGEVVWNASEAVNSRPPFPQWSAPESLDEFTPRTSSAMSGMLEVKGDELSKVATLTTRMFPADHGLIVLERLQSLPLAWLSCYKDRHVFGLRASPSSARPFLEKKAAAVKYVASTPQSAHVAHFFADFDDGLRVVVCEGQSHPAVNTVSLTMTLPTGLVVTAQSDGGVSMRYVSVAKVGVPLAAREELSRSVGAGGTLTRWLRDGSTELFQASGTTLLRDAGASHYVMTQADGTRRRVLLGSSKKGKEGQEEGMELVSEELLPVESSVETDPETVAKVQTTSATTLVTFRDGSTLARFRDGTTIRQDTTKGFVLVENACGFASVHLDLLVDRTARKHAKGEKVPVATGGERMRCRVALPDGSKVICTYNTRITSNVRGKLILVRPDMSELVAADSPLVDACTVSFRPRGVWAGGAAKGLVPGDPIEAAVTATVRGEDQGLGEGVGCYEFNLFHGRMEMEDQEHNVFFASVNPDKAEKNDKGATYDVDLAGKIHGDDVKAEAVVNSPIPPRLFVVSRDGTATEYLRPDDVAEFERLVALGALTVTSTPEEPLLTDPLDKPATQHVHHIHVTRPKLPTFANAFPESEYVAWHHWPLPVCSRTATDTHPRAPAHVIAPRITIRRVWVKVTPLSKAERSTLIADLAACEAFRVARELSVNRFAVVDDRSPAEIAAEAAMRKHLRKALKQANAKKRAKAKSSATDARSTNAEGDEEKCDAASVESMQDALAAVETESGAFIAEVEAAFAAHAETTEGGCLLCGSLVEALVQVCNRAVSDAEAEGLLRSQGLQGLKVPFDSFLAMSRRAVHDELARAQDAQEARQQEEVEAKARAFALSLGRPGSLIGRPPRTDAKASPKASPTATIGVKTGAFWDSATGQQLIADGLQPPPPPGGETPVATVAAGGGLNAARAASKKRASKGGGSVGSADQESPPQVAIGPSAGDAGPTFEVFPDYLDLGSVAAPSGGVAPFVVGVITLKNVSPFAARFRVRSGPRGLARLAGKQARPGPVASGESVRLTIELRSDDGGFIAEDEIVIVSEHQEIIVPVSAQVFRTKPR